MYLTESSVQVVLKKITTRTKEDKVEKVAPKCNICIVFEPKPKL